MKPALSAALPALTHAATVPLLTGALDMVRIPTRRPATHAGEMLRGEFLVPLGMTQRELAEKIGVSLPRIHEIPQGKGGITPDTALRLERLFGVSAQFWMNLQMAVDLYEAQHSKHAEEIERIQPLARAAGG